MPCTCLGDRSPLPRRGPRVRSFPIVRANPRRTVSPCLHPLVRQRREGFLPASDARPACLAAPRCCFVSETRAARCVRPTSASHNFYRLRAPVSRRFRARVGAARAPRVPRSGSASRHSPRFGGSRFFSSTHRGAFSSPRAPRDRTSGTSVTARALLSSFVESDLAHDRDRLCLDAR